MSWYLAKIVYQIICGDGSHTAQFAEQLRLIAATDEDVAFEKAILIGQNEEDNFCNQKNDLVQWRFINVAELYKLTNLIDGAELYSRITEADDAASYINFINEKAASIKNKQSRRLLQLI